MIPWPFNYHCTIDPTQLDKITHAYWNPLELELLDEIQEDYDR